MWTCRLIAGWIPAAERSDINFLTSGATDENSTGGSGAPPPSSSASTGASANAGEAATLREVVLWPFDRGESRGKLKVVTLRIGVDELLTLSYR